MHIKLLSIIQRHWGYDSIDEHIDEVASVIKEDLDIFFDSDISITEI